MSSFTFLEPRNFAVFETQFVLGFEKLSRMMFAWLNLHLARGFLRKNVTASWVIIRGSTDHDANIRQYKVVMFACVVYPLIKASPIIANGFLPHFTSAKIWAKGERISSQCVVSGRFSRDCFQTLFDKDGLYKWLIRIRLAVLLGDIVRDR